MNIRFSNSDVIYQMLAKASGSNLVKLLPPIPDDIDITSGFVVLTDKGRIYGDYRAYTTVYREMEDGSIFLSNDGSVYVPPPPPPVVEPEPVKPPEGFPDTEYLPSLEERVATLEEHVLNNITGG